MSTLPPPQMPSPVPQPSAVSWYKRRFAKLPLWAWAIIVLVVVAAAASGGSKDKSADTSGSVAPAAGSTPSSDSPSVSETQPTEAPATTDAAVTTEAAEPTTQAVVTAAATSTTAASTVPPTEAPPALPGFSDGISLVGSDAPAGIYLTTVPDGGFGCYWARLTDVSGDFEAIIANDNVAPGGQVIVEIAATDGAFESNDCGAWSPYFAPDTPATAFGEGTWIVGQQIAAGRYRSDAAGESGNCYWERKSGVTGTFDDILANNNSEGPTVVDIAAGDMAFKSSGCGSWALA